MAPFQRKRFANDKLPHLEPRSSGVAKTQRSRTSLAKRVQPYLARFDSYLSNQRPVYESPLFNVLRSKTSSEDSEYDPTKPLLPEPKRRVKHSILFDYSDSEEEYDPDAYDPTKPLPEFVDETDLETSEERKNPFSFEPERSNTYSFQYSDSDDDDDDDDDTNPSNQYNPPRSVRDFKAARVLHTSDLGAWFTHPRLEPNQDPVSQEELHRLHCGPGNSSPPKRERLIEDDSLEQWAQHNWAIGQGAQGVSHGSAGGKPGYKHGNGKYSGLDATQRTKLFDRLLGPFPTKPKNFRSPPTPSAPTLPARFTQPVPERFLIAARKRFLDSRTNTYSPTLYPSLKRSRHFLPADEHVGRTKRFKRTALDTDSTFTPVDERADRTKRFKRTSPGGDVSIAPIDLYDLGQFKPRGRTDREPLKGFDATKTRRPSLKVLHRRSIGGKHPSFYEQGYRPFLRPTPTDTDSEYLPTPTDTDPEYLPPPGPTPTDTDPHYLPNPRPTPTDTDSEYLPTPRPPPTETGSEYLPSPSFISTDHSGPESRLSQRHTPTDGSGSLRQFSKMPASTTPTPPPPTTKNHSTTKPPSTAKIVLPSKISKPRSAIPQPLPSQITAHLRTTPALGQLNSTLLLALKRQNWAHHVRAIARELLISGRCSTYDEVLAVVIGAATQSLRNTDPEKEAKEQKKKRKRVEEGDISDDEFDSDGERVEDGIVMGGQRKKKMVDRLLGELKEQGVYTDIGIPRTVVEEGVGIVKGALKDVVVYEDA